MKSFYDHMMNAIYGLQDDFDANNVPESAKDLLREIIEICESDYMAQFGKR